MVSSIGLGVMAAAGNALLAIWTARFASTKTVAAASGIVLLSMGARLTILAVLFWRLFELGYQLLPLVVSFVITYTIFVWLEIALLNKGKE